MTRFHPILTESIRAHTHKNVFGSGFAATHAVLEHPNESVEDLNWKSRAHRKRRYRTLDEKGRKVSEEEEVLWIKVRRMGKIEWKELSWWIAVLFTFGSVVWVVNGFIVFLPQINSSKYHQNEAGGGWTAWLGATIFEFGAVVALLEAMNRDENVDFGGEDKTENYENDDEKGLKEGKRRKRFTFFPRNRQLWHEIGFVAGFVQFWAATIFWISGWTGLPKIFDTIQSKSTRLEDGVYWTPQVIGGSGFVIASLLYMLENQHRWWKPAPLSLGWHVGFWNLVGAIGFTLCGIFGYSRFVPQIPSRPTGRPSKVPAPPFGVDGRS